MCDDAENLAGAGTDVRRRSDALGPRKNLHGHVPLRYEAHGVHFIGMKLMGVHLTSTYVLGMKLIGVHLIGVYVSCMKLIGVHLIGMHLMGVYLLISGPEVAPTPKLQPKLRP